MYYVSPKLQALGVAHAFSTRCGGISPAPFDSLNLGNPNGCDVQDDYARIWANYARLLNAIDCPNQPPLRVHQVHGNRVVRVNAANSFDVADRADAIVSNDAARPISVRTADCVPILLASTDGKSVAAIHAGWRGIVAGVIPAAIAEMICGAPGLSPQSLVAAIGPCIGRDAFEVGPDVVLAFDRLFAGRAPLNHLPGGKALIDLKAAVGLQLLGAGMSEDCIDSTDRCTVTHRDEFFSHRRDGGVTGRMAAVILCKA
ncbi:MAG: peptidoglycan editing factor PgeF [Planctomycetota bacterium]|nr:peptidoglycan editing factor PgeF [Planctomycetota bacterium]